MKHIFDLDNTLVYTDRANNCAYNMALKQMGIAPIEGETRITRKTVLKKYPDLTRIQVEQIIAEKMALYCVQKTYTNSDLVRYAREQGRDNCFVWSSADRKRAFSIMKYHGINELFSDIYFSPKLNICQEFEEMTQYFLIDSSQLIVYEDTDRYIEELRNAGVKVVDAKHFSLSST